MATKAQGVQKRSSPRFKFRWQNFRSFEDTGWIEVRPITILIGANNSGKTSLMRPLLLMKQTMESRDAGIALKTTGPLANVGRFRDFVFRHRIGREVSFSLRFQELNQSKAEKKIEPILFYPPDELTVRFGAGEEPSDIKLTEFLCRDTHGRTVLVRRLLKNSRYGLVFPGRLEPAFFRMAANTKPAHFLFQSYRILDKIFEREEAKKRTTKGARTNRGVQQLALRFSDRASTYLSLLHYVGNQTSALCSRLSYIGPLREHPSRFYQSKEELPMTVGLRGEDAPQVLFLKEDERFRTDVNRWLKSLGLTSRAWCAKLDEDLFSVITRDPITKSRVNFADTGFGLSQLLPLVVQAFHSPPGSLIFLEQPEIHLNPRLQCHLSGLLTAVAEAGKTVVVETHSEHLVLALRALIAEGKLKSEDVGLYYVERSGAKSTARQIPIQKDGFIESDQWPRGFFEESLTEAFRLARPLSSVQ